MADFKTNGDMFGRYVRIQTDFSKSLHIYKVVSRFESNTYCDIPILVSSKEVQHEQVVPVLNVIHCGIDESKVIRVALDDCEIVPTNTADVAPVRHAHWKRYHEADIGWDEWGVRCSNCGLEVEDKDFTFPDRFCPNCGAWMDLEDEA